jgi:hypothetical protein
VSDTNPSTPKPLRADKERRLLDVAVRRLGGQTWKQVAADLGWRSPQAAQQWSAHNLDRYWEWADAGGRR